MQRFRISKSVTLRRHVAKTPKKICQGKQVGRFVTFQNGFYGVKGQGWTMGVTEKVTVVGDVSRRRVGR